MKESERLRAAKALIDNPEKWMQGDYSNIDDLAGLEYGCKFCALGAIRKAYSNDGIVAYDNTTELLYLEKALILMGVRREVHTFNDTHTHAEVMEMFDKAIELAEDEGN